MEANSTACNISEVQLPDGLNTSDIQCINANGVMAYIHNSDSNNAMVANGMKANTAVQGTVPMDASSPSPSPVGTLLPPDISITVGYGPVDRSTIDNLLTGIPGFQSTTTKGDIITYVYNGKDGAGKFKQWTVQTNANAASFKSALQDVPYVAYLGHANSGLGIAVKATASSSDFTAASIHGISDFLHFKAQNTRANQTAFNYDYAKTHVYSGLTFPTSSQIPSDVKNYSITGFPNNSLEDWLDNKNTLRYPNDPNGQGTPDGGVFHIQGSGNDSYHFTRTKTGKQPEPFLVVNTATASMPPLGYKIFLDCQCYSARDYSEVYNHGCFIGTTDEAAAVPDPVVAFVTALVSGTGNNDVVTAINNTGYDEYAQKNN